MNIFNLETLLNELNVRRVCCEKSRQNHHMSASANRIVKPNFSRTTKYTQATRHDDVLKI